MIDLRSDTITRPTPEMRKIMAEAEVGDDVWGDDPSVASLEEQTAEILGMEAAVYMPSGTMTNQVAIRTHTQPGDELMIEENGHIYGWEAGGPAALSGVMTRLIKGNRGIFEAQDLEKVMRPIDLHHPRPSLVCVENTCNRGGGTVWSLEKLSSIVECSRKHNLKLHMDGARLWNASVALQVPESKILTGFDTVSVCFSKGLGAPVGSALAGTREFIKESRRFRKQFGGGMRQAGIIAAAALYALDNHKERLAKDHENAKILAFGLAEIPGISLKPENVETNIIFFNLNGISAHEFEKRLLEHYILVEETESDVIRVVTNMMVKSSDIHTVLSAVQEVMKGS